MERVIAQLVVELPEMEAADEPDEKLRAVLRPLVILASHGGSESQIERDPATCPNCGMANTFNRTPYCKDTCKQMAAFVRQFRAALADETLLEAGRQSRLGQALWSLQGGGYPRRQLMVPAKTVEKVIAREGGVCSVCGGLATEIDHTGSG